MHVNVLPFWASNDPLILGFGHAITTAGNTFELATVAHDDLAALHINRLFDLKRMQRLGYARTAHTQHERQKLMCQGQVIATKPVMARQKPSSQSFLDAVAAVRKSRVRELDQARMDVPKKQAANGRPFIHRFG